MDYSSHSWTIKAIGALERFYQCSRTHLGLARLAELLKPSRTYRFFQRLASRESGASSSLTFRALGMICNRAQKPALRIKASYETSFLYRLFVRTLKPENAVVPIPNIVYVAALYVFIDYILRDVLHFSYAGYWDELVLIAAVGIWLFKILSRGRNGIDRWTPLDIPLMFFLGVCLFLLVVNSPNIGISLEGFRAVAQYMLWFFLAIRLINSRDTAKKVYVILVLSGTLLALHGVIQYVIGVEMPSHWQDLAEKGVRTRVFSIIGSPNILGSMMLMLFPMALSLFYTDDNLFRKVFYLGSAFVIGLCLVFTFSRGAWLGMVFAAVIFILLKDKRLVIPFLAMILLILLLVPSVGDRITYMLSSQYMTSSLGGGRLGRMIEGLEMFKNNLPFGVGLGHFGGAVAKNNNIPGTFYMDNYYLKTAVEMGITGLLAFLVLVYNTVIWSYRSIRRMDDSHSRILSQGAFAGLCGILVHNIGENVFEEPMMVTYFWIIAALIFIMARSRQHLYAGNDNHQSASL